jgi:hypothetical protein
MQITDRHIEIYVNKYYGEKIDFIKKKFNLKSANNIYYYCCKIDNEVYSGGDKILIEKIENAKKNYKEWKIKSLQLMF